MANKKNSPKPNPSGGRHRRSVDPGEKTATKSEAFPKFRQGAKDGRTSAKEAKQSQQDASKIEAALRQDPRHIEHPK